MYTYCDKGGAVAAVVLGYYVEGEVRGVRLLRTVAPGAGKGFASTLLHSRTPPSSAIETKTTNMVCSTIKDPLHTTLNSIAIDPYCLVSPAARVSVQKKKKKSPMHKLFALVNWILTVIQYHV